MDGENFDPMNLYRWLKDHFVQFRNDDYCVVYCYVFSISDHLSGTL